MHRLRTVIFSIYVALVTILVTIVWSPGLAFGKHATVAGCRNWARMALFGLKAICGVSYRIENAHYIPKGGAIIAANHQSMWETIVFFALLERPVMVFKQELMKIPLYGLWARRSGSIPVDRDAGAKAIRALTKIARERLDEGSQIVLFPEGTRVPYGERGELQPGIVAIYVLGGAPCVPATHDSGRFWHFPGGLNSLKTPGIITLRFDRPIEPGLDRKTFTAELEQRFNAGERQLRARTSAAASEAPEGSTLA